MLFTNLLFVTGFGILEAVLAAPGSVCNSGIYKALLPLSNYPAAESYCSAHYPLPAATVTTTSTTTSTTTAGAASKRTAAPAPNPANAASLSKIWSALLQNAQSIVKTACSCIETTSTKTVTTTTTTTTTTTSSPQQPTCTYVDISKASCPADDGKQITAQGYVYKVSCGVTAEGHGGNFDVQAAPYTFASCYAAVGNTNGFGPGGIESISFGDCCAAAQNNLVCDTNAQSTCGLQNVCYVCSSGQFTGVGSATNEAVAVLVSGVQGC